MKSLYISLFALVTFSLLTFITLSFLTPQIELRLKNNVIAAMIENNLNWVNVSAEGRHITLKGQAPTHELHLQAKKQALNISGVEKINSQITITNALENYTLTVDYDGDKLSLEGYALDEKTRSHINDSVMGLYGKNKVISQWQFREGQPSAWAMVTSGIISTLKILNYGKVVFKNQTVNLLGTAASPDLKEEIDKKLLAYTHQGYVIQTDIKVIIPAISCQEKFEKLLQQEQILFTKGGFNIDSSSYSLLERLKLIMNECKDFGVIISGYTDSKGDEEKNQVLSLNRAKSVSNHLIKKGINVHQVSTIGYGELKPIADNETKEGRAKNRRIEFTIKGM